MTGKSAGACTIAVDAMGGDHGPAEIVAGMALALKQHREMASLIVVGDKAQLEPALKEHGLAENPRLKLHHASEVVGMEDKPIQALKAKKDSSMARAVELVKDGRADAIISCGNTGALMAAGTLKLRPVAGIERPALATMVPSDPSPFLLIDSGAAPTPRPEHLVHNAILGARYFEATQNKERPRVGLLTIGTEEGKGTERTNIAHELFKQCGDILNYSGPVEGFHLFQNEVDVVVTDGFTGNILLKSLESVYNMLKGVVKDEITRTPLRKLAALLLRGAFRDMKARVDPTPHAGAPLLGVNGLLVKAHGSSERAFIAGAIGVTVRALHHDMAERVQEDLGVFNARRETAKEVAREKAGVEG